MLLEISDVLTFAIYSLVCSTRWVMVYLVGVVYFLSRGRRRFLGYTINTLD
jgi:hypothetical protein